MDPENQPQPSPAPAPAVPEHVTCPSCGSVYAPATRELVTDTGLGKTIRELEAKAEEWRTTAQGLRHELEVANGRVIELQHKVDSNPAPSRKKQNDFDFKIGSKE